MTAALAVALALSSFSRAEEQEPITVTATRISEDIAQVPASVTVVGGAQLRDTGAADLGRALSLAAGVDMAPGGDGGPAAYVPEFWGLKEFDAFLLVVDGVPWGGAFNPALAAIDLNDVERVEVVRGAAPVMYGATSFVGVIHVIHKTPERVEREARAFAGNFGSRGLGASLPLPALGSLKSAVSADSDRQGFSDPRTLFTRDHAAWRGSAETPLGKLHGSAEVFDIRQNPASPHLREGPVLSSRVPLDSNQNPVDAFLNEERIAASLGLEHELFAGTWSTLVSYGHSDQKTLRGFLTDITQPLDAHGFREDIGLTDIYADSHVDLAPREGLKLVSGLDYLHGRGSARGGDFDYTVNLDGSAAPSGGRLPSQADVRITDQRDFFGLYGFVEWEPVESWVVEAGARLNRTSELRRTSNFDLASTTVLDSDFVQQWRASGSAGLTWRAWKSGSDLVNAFASYRDTFKPSAVDFGLDTPAQILPAESAESYELGLKSRWLDDRLDLNVSSFLMDFNHVAVPTTINGNPALEAAGQTRHSGLEVEGSLRLLRALTWRVAYSLHAARYRDFVDTSGAAPVSFTGNRVENSARNMAASALTWAPGAGWTATAQVNYVGSRFLDRANTALAKQYATWSAGVGWRAGRWEVRVDGRNLSDQRPPVSESELGDGQYYLLPSRRVDLSTSWKF